MTGYSYLRTKRPWSGVVNVLDQSGDPVNREANEKSRPPPEEAIGFREQSGEDEVGLIVESGGAHTGEMTDAGAGHVEQGVGAHLGETEVGEAGTAQAN
jgi:hypothetical protein